MPAGSEFCAECGAPLTDAPGVGGSDAEVYPELARANLARMRKEWKQAEDICLSILRRFPNNHSSNTLLGDIAAERGDLEQAAEWYELALDIVPDDEETKLKLQTAKDELSTRQTQTTVETLGIPPKRAPIALYLMITLVVAAFTVATVMMLNKPKETGPNPNTPIVLEDQKLPAKTDIEEPTTPDEAPVTYKIDDDLAASIATDAQMDGRALTASIADPGGSVRLILHAVGTDGEWIQRARVVMSAFKLRVDAPKVELQYLTSADPKPETQFVVRSSFEQTQAADFDLTNEALVVETLFGHKMVVPTPQDPNTEPNNTITPPVGEGGDKSSESGSGATGG